MTMRKKFNGYLFALFAIFFWSFNVIYSKYLANTFSPMEISFIRWFIPSVLFLPFMYKSIWEYRYMFVKYWRIMVIMTLTGLSFQNTLVYYAGYTARAVDMALIGATSPIYFVIFAAIFLHVKVYFKQILGIIFAILGVVFIILDGHFANFDKITLTVGDLFMLASAVIFAIYAVVQKKLPADFAQLPAFTLMICFSSLLLLPFALYDFITLPAPVISKRDVVILIILGVFNSGVAYFAWNKAIAVIGAIRTGTMYYLMPIFSTIEAYFLLNEKIYVHQIYGILLIVLGIFISSVGNQKANDELHTVHKRKEFYRHEKKQKRAKRKMFEL